MRDADKYIIPIPIKFNNLALDSLYGRLVQQCTECKINMTADIRFRKFGFLSEFDACLIFGNLFDNALEACANVVEEKRRIDLTISINQNIVVITLIISHAFKIICIPESNLLLSARRGYRSEGFGIKNIQSTLIKYNGYLSCTHTADEFRGIIRMDIHLERQCQIAVKSFREMAITVFLPPRRFLRARYLLFSSGYFSDLPAASAI